MGGSKSIFFCLRETERAWNAPKWDRSSLDLKTRNPKLLRLSHLCLGFTPFEIEGEKKALGSHTPFIPFRPSKMI